MTKVILPALGEGVNKAMVSYWFVQPGDTVKEKQDLVELTTDKAAFNLPCPCNGVLSEITAPEGQTVAVGEVLALIQEQ